MGPTMTSVRWCLCVTWLTCARWCARVSRVPPAGLCCNLCGTLTGRAILAKSPQPSGLLSAPSGDRGHGHGVIPNCEHAPGDAALLVRPFWCGPFGGWGTHAPLYGGRGTHAPRAGRDRLGVGAHMPRKTGVVAHAPHTRPAIRARKRQPIRKSHHDVTLTRVPSRTPGGTVAGA